MNSTPPTTTLGVVTWRLGNRAQALWRIVSGTSKPPTLSAPPREGEEDKLEAWEVKADKAAGIM